MKVKFQCKSVTVTGTKDTPAHVWLLSQVIDCNRAECQKARDIYFLSLCEKSVLSPNIVGLSLFQELIHQENGKDGGAESLQGNIY